MRVVAQSGVVLETVHDEDSKIHEARGLLERVLVKNSRDKRSSSTNLRLIEVKMAPSVTPPDADAAHMRKVPCIMQMRETRQMQIDEDACIGN